MRENLRKARKDAGMTMEECAPSEVVWAGVVLTDLTRELLERYEKIQLS